jgi:carboxymethylenebutenolidase
MADIKTADVTFPVNGVEGSGYLARPADGQAHPGVIVIQEWWGMDGHIKDIAERFAREGFVALAPDLYHGAVATEPDEARKLVMGMNRERALADLKGALEHLLAQDDVAPKKAGVIGFCMGGAMTLALACESPKVAAGAPFYAGMMPGADRLKNVQAELFCAFGADDAGIPLENVRNFEANLKDLGKKAEVKVYEGAPHSFFNDTKSSYRPDAAADAWQQSLALFKRVLV